MEAIGALQKWGFPLVCSRGVRTHQPKQPEPLVATTRDDSSKLRTEMSAKDPKDHFPRPQQGEPTWDTHHQPNHPPGPYTPYGGA